jgi:hypothetical protein
VSLIGPDDVDDLLGRVREHDGIRPLAGQVGKPMLVLLADGLVGRETRPEFGGKLRAEGVQPSLLHAAVSPF